MQRTYRIIFAIFVASIAIWCPRNTMATLAPADTFKELIGLPLVLLMTAIFIFTRKNKEFIEIPKVKMNLAITALVSFAALSYFWATNKYEYYIDIMPWISALAIYFIVLLTTKTKKDYLFLTELIFYSGFTVAFIGILQQLFDFNYFMQAVKPSSTLGNKNLAGQFTAMSICLGLGPILKFKDIKKTIIHSIMIVLMVTFTFYVTSRAVWLTLSMISITLSLLFYKYKKSTITELLTKKKVITLAISLLSVFILSNTTDKGLTWRGTEIIERVKSITDTKQESNKTRLSIWRNSLEFLKISPILGQGIGNWRVSFPKVHNKAVKDAGYNDRFFLSNPHNEYINLISSLGFIGIFLLLWIAYLIFKMTFKLLNDETFTEKSFTIRLFCSILAICSAAFFSFPLQGFLGLIILATLLAILSNIYYGHFKTEETDDKFFLKILPSVKYTSAILILSFSYLAWSKNYRILKGYNYFIYGRNSYNHEMSKRKNPVALKKIVKYFEKAYEYNPKLATNLIYWALNSYALKKHHFAIDKLWEAHELYPNDKIILKKLFIFHLQNKEIDQALKAATLMKDRVPYFFFGYWGTGDIMWKKGKFQEAIGYFKQAKKLNPDLKLIPQIEKLLNTKDGLKKALKK